MILTDLTELKKILEIDPDDTQEDARLWFYIEWASAWIEEIINRPGLIYKTRTEYYQGTGTQKLLLRSRPVYLTPAMEVYVDEAAYWGQSPGPPPPYDTNTLLTQGQDYALQIDTDDGTSRCGILYRLNQFWPKPSYRQTGYLTPFIGPDRGSIKIVYTAGYTVDTLPAPFRAATNLLVAKMRYLFPLGMEIHSEAYEERSISLLQERKDYLLSNVKDMIMPYRNYRW